MPISNASILVFFIGEKSEYTEFVRRERKWVEDSILSFGFDVEFFGVLQVPPESYNAKRQQYNAGIFLREVSRKQEMYIRGSFETEVRRFKIQGSGIRSGNIKFAGLGITKKDIYFSNLNFVFGLASPTAYCAVVSLRRLDPEFYGYPQDDELYNLRVRKEVMHEIGHVFGLPHCSDYSCVMSFSNSIDDVDRKKDVFCSSCMRIFRREYY